MTATDPIPVLDYRTPEKQTRPNTISRAGVFLALNYLTGACGIFLGILTLGRTGGIDDIFILFGDYLLMVLQALLLFLMLFLDFTLGRTEPGSTHLAIVCALGTLSANSIPLLLIWHPK